MKQEIWLLPLALISLAGHADDSANIVNSGANNTGIVSINETAGAFNQQQNNRSIGMNTSSGDTTANATQNMTLSQDSLALANQIKNDTHSASITGSSFSNSHGIVGINQIAGAFNQASNQVTINVNSQNNIANSQNSIYTLSNTALMNTSSDGENTTSQNNNNSNNKTFIADDAFHGASGVVQVNQVAGVMNQAVNGVAVNLVALPGH